MYNISMTILSRLLNLSNNKSRKHCGLPSTCGCSNQDCYPTGIPSFRSRSFHTFLTLVLTVVIINISCVQDKTPVDQAGGPLIISPVQAVFLRLSPERQLIKTIDPNKARIKKGRLKLDVDIYPYDVIDVDIEASSPRFYYMHFYYWMKGNVNLPITDSYYSLRLADDPDILGRRIVNRFEALPVNRRADKLDSMIFPEPPKGMNVDNFTFYGRVLFEDLDTALEDITVQSEFGLNIGTPLEANNITAVFAAREETEGKAKVAARGLRFELANLQAVYHVGLNHRPTALPFGPTRIGKFAPQTLILIDLNGDVHTVGTHGADLIEVDREKNKAVITIYDYHFRERTHYFKDRKVSEKGVRMNINAGFTRRLTEGRLSIFHRAGSEVAFLSRHQKGHLATLTIGDHADHVTIETDPLIMFGHDDGEIRINGQGFIGNDIPITRTVFGVGGGEGNIIRKVWQDHTTPSISEKVSSLEQTPELRRLFDLYLEAGAHIEYGPHSSALSRAAVSEKTKTRKTMARALKRLEPYSPRISIDHAGLEVIHVFGWNKTDPLYYTLDILRRAGIDYIYAFADKYSGKLTLLHADQASNVFYKLPAIAESIPGHLDPYFFAQSQLTWDETLFSVERLGVMIKQRGFLNLHTYLGNDITLPVFDDNNIFHGDYTLVPWFNKHLENIDALRDQGDLWLGLNSEVYDFQRDLDTLSIKWNNSCLDVSGEHEQKIGGVTLAIGFFENGKWAEVPNEALSDRTMNNREKDMIDYYWFDMVPGNNEYVCLRKEISN